MWPYLAVEVEGHCPESMQKLGVFRWVNQREIRSGEVVKIEKKMREEGLKIFSMVKKT